MNGGLQLLAVLLLGWTVATPRDHAATGASRQLLALLVAALALIVLQLVPLPPALWSSLPGRDVAASGFELLGHDLPWMPLSLAPYATLEAAYALFPAIAVLAMVVASGERKDSWIALAVIAGALANVLLGAVQVASSGTARWAYLHEITNTGAVGFFANRNHMATLLLAAIPFAGALYASSHPGGANRSKAFAMLALGVGSFVLILAGLVLNQSLAALALAAPVVASTALLMPAGWRIRRLVLPLCAVALAGAMIVLGNSAIRSEFGDAVSQGASLSRSSIWDVTFGLIAQTFPFGTGVGSFPYIFALHEDPAAVMRSYVNHAHNDYLEIVLEMGLAGLVLLVLFLGWWARQVLRVWRSPMSSPFAKAATIASGAILAHSIVDYPLRTAAISAVFAACIAMMAQGRAEGRSDAPRHVRIG